MIKYACSKTRFNKNIKKHKMTILKDDGLYRHLHFADPQDSHYWFDIVTYPHNLIISGDRNTFHFSRIEDMFKFFIMDDRDFNKKNVINPHYWSEKIKGGKDHIEVYSEDAVKAYVKERFKNYTEDHGIRGEEKKELWEKIQENILDYPDDQHNVYKNLYHFDGNNMFEDTDFNFNEFSLSYIWCCYAIVWGITKYNKLKGKSNEQEKKNKSN